ncbi:MAG: BA14K family protein [Nitratireductor sp.]|nr:BA14K family protein [Nitratireductor sp.]
MTQDTKTATTVLKKLTLAGAAGALALTTVLPVAAAHADHRRWKRGHDVVVLHKPIGKQHRKYKRHHHRSNDGDLLAAGVIGFAVGALIADQASRQPPVVYVQPRPTYVQRQPLPAYGGNPYQGGYGEPKVITYNDGYGGTYEPWTPEWRAWCDANYRSFNANTGTYRGYDGLDHFCVVK